MQVTVAGVLASFVAIFLLLKRPEWLFYAALFLAPFSGTSVLNMPSASFGFPVSLFMFLCHIVGLIFRGRLGASICFARSQMPVFLLLLAFAFLLIASLWPRVLDGTLLRVNITMTIYVCINTSITLLTASTLRTERDFLRALRVQAASTVFVSSWGLFQFIAPLVGIPYPDWLFNNSTAHAANLFAEVTASGIVRVGSVAVEPSILVQSLSCFLAVAATLLVRRKPVLGCLGIVALATGFGCVTVSTSSTGYLGLGVLAILLIFQSPVRSTILSSILVAISIVILASEPRLLDAILANTIDKSSSWSFDKRTETVVEAIDLFLDHPLMGVGWATQSAYSMPAFLLVNTGVIGASVFLCLLTGLVLILLVTIHLEDRASRQFRATSEKMTRLPLSDLALGLLNALAIDLVMQTVSGFTYVFPDFWILAGFILAISRLTETQNARRPGLCPPAIARDIDRRDLLYLRSIPDFSANLVERAFKHAATSSGSDAADVGRNGRWPRARLSLALFGLALLLPAATIALRDYARMLIEPVGKIAAASSDAPAPVAASLGIVGREFAALPPAPARGDTPPQGPETRKAVAAVEPALSPGVLATLMRRGNASLAEGDITAARLLFGRGAGTSAIAATAEGTTYDPNVLSRIGARSVQPDRNAAELWYRRAMAMGDKQAARLLERLMAVPNG